MMTMMTMKMTCFLLIVTCRFLTDQHDVVEGVVYEVAAQPVAFTVPNYPMVTLPLPAQPMFSVPVGVDPLQGLVTLAEDNQLTEEISEKNNILICPRGPEIAKRMIRPSGSKIQNKLLCQPSNSNTAAKMNQ